jgi:hypothetical protein
MHPLLDNIKSLSYEELEKKSTMIQQRLQMMRRGNMQNPLMWDQLLMMQDSINNEKQERAQLLNQSSQPDRGSVVINTDPLEDDDAADAKPPSRNSFNPIS